MGVTRLSGDTKPPQTFPLRQEEHLGNVVENGGLDRRKRPDVSRRGREHQGRTYLIRPLNQSNRELRPERHHGATPCLPSRGIVKIVRLEVISKVIDVALGALVIHIQIARSHEPEQRGNAPAQPAHSRNGLGCGGERRKHKRQPDQRQPGFHPTHGHAFRFSMDTHLCLWYHPSTHSVWRNPPLASRSLS